MTKYRSFQRQDYARLAMVDSAILGHDTGLGKSWAGYTIALLKCGFAREGHRIVPKAPVLIVGPGDLHSQWIKEGAENFKVHVTPLDSQETFLRLSTLDKRTGQRRLPPGFYITSYTELGHNGVRLLPKPDKLKTADDIRAALAFVEQSWADVEEFHTRAEWARLRAEAADAAREGRRVKAKTPRPLAALALLDQLTVARRCLQARTALLGENMGNWNTDVCEDHLPQTRRIRCVLDPTLGDLCGDAFECVVVDEATKLKGGFETQIASGVLQMNPRYRLVCTATPIKNRLPNIFPLAWWACGGRLEANPRWPYALETAGDFAKTFCVTERNLSRERAETGKVRRSRFSKLTPQVCNVHKVWKLLAPILPRRRKKDIGEEIVGKTRQVYRVPMGTLQAQVYKQHLDWTPVDRNGQPAIGPKLQALRMAAAAPHSPLLSRARGPAYCPKLAATLTLLEQVLCQGKQVIVFSPFHDPLDELQRRLEAAAVGVEVLDGRMSQENRAEAALRFKKRGYPVLLASNECMAEGHSFPNCSYVIQYAYPWALDKVLQSEDRAHRLNSVDDLQVFRLITEGSIDRKMESQLDEKADAAELVLDGYLLGEAAEEVDLAELLEIAAREFSEKTITIDEAVLEAEWPNLRERLRKAAREWALGNQTAERREQKLKVQTPSFILPAPLNWRQEWARRQAQATSSKV